MSLRIMLSELERFEMELVFGFGIHGGEILDRHMHPIKSKGLSLGLGFQFFGCLGFIYIPEYFIK